MAIVLPFAVFSAPGCREINRFVDVLDLPPTEDASGKCRVSLGFLVAKKFVILVMTGDDCILGSGGGVDPIGCVKCCEVSDLSKL